MIPDTTNLEELLGTLPLKGEIIPTSGIGFGVIVRFKTFYLKVYDAPKVNSYEISGYLLDTLSEKPKFTFIVPYDRFHEFASQITRDNYLRDPIRITWPILTTDDRTGDRNFN